MLHFFNVPTKIYISFEARAVAVNPFLSIGYSSIDYRSCPNELNFQTVYQDIEEKITSMGAGKIALKINLKGRLNSKEIQEDFYDLASFRDFLVQYSLIPRHIVSINTMAPAMAIEVNSDSRTRSNSTNYQFTLALLGAFITALCCGSYLYLNLSQNQREEESVQGYGVSL
jgi:hypothetical protein